jgi:hypothetical protein
MASSALCRVVTIGNSHLQIPEAHVLLIVVGRIPCVNAKVADQRLVGRAITPAAGF